ncbi:hypothetical protein HPB50_001198 [Hyalomma asiaticum]|uniref:Uncharacterized protein n=1 Tax=Hyalomma asiaticum TaxID=266040 RepID=A0ACB7SFD8_HYAAI|nr:hypothetical protein HPB50_001198 [Hyalomma asiaticum]
MPCNRKRSAVWAFFTEDEKTKDAMCDKCGRRYSKPATETLRYHMLHAHFIDVPKERPTMKRSREDDDDADDCWAAEGASTYQPIQSEQGVAESAPTTVAVSEEPYYAARSPCHSTPSSRDGSMDNCLSCAATFARGGDGEKKATDALAYMIVHDDLPLCVPDKDGFKTFVKALQPHYKLPTEPTVTKILKAKYAELREHVECRIQQVDHLAITADIWTHESTELANVETGVAFIPEGKTSRDLSVAMRDLCNQWRIDQAKVRVVVTDGGETIKAAVHDVFGADKHVSCVAHVLNQVGEAALGLEVSKVPSELEAHEFLLVPENEQEAEPGLEDVVDADCGGADATSIAAIRTLLMKVKRIVHFFRTSKVASHMLIKTQVQDGKLNDEPMKLIQHVGTKWISCYHMLERFLKLSQPVNGILSKLQKDEGGPRERLPDVISADELQVLDEVKDLLKPLEEATKIVSSVSSVTLGDVIPMIYGLKQASHHYSLHRGIQNFQPSHPVVFTVQQKLFSEIDTRFSDIEFQRPYAVATILDPRYKNHLFEHPQAVATIVRHLGGRIAERVRGTGCVQAVDLAEMNATPPSEIWAAVDRALRRNLATMEQDSMSEMPSQFKAYYNNLVVDRRANPNPLETWLRMRYKYRKVSPEAVPSVNLPVRPHDAKKQRMLAAKRLREKRVPVRSYQLPQTNIPTDADISSNETLEHDAEGEPMECNAVPDESSGDFIQNTEGYKYRKVSPEAVPSVNLPVRPHDAKKQRMLAAKRLREKRVPVRSYQLPQTNIPTDADISSNETLEHDAEGEPMECNAVPDESSGDFIQNTEEIAAEAQELSEDIGIQVDTSSIPFSR